MVAVYGDFGEGLGIAYFHISFANDKMNDTETYIDEVAMWPVPNLMAWVGFLTYLIPGNQYIDIC